ncbi:D-glycero-beta-D-manno-heptose 1-phosphate adenylyltransferase [Jiangella ureilytica]|uniref:D-glycero-beta-D-manno-heptose 1-phosphate adenylyltransferase n=1 Tax=Jiangella ureilytica TaxID=2530374 RepID=A0A4R4RS97_9ACTN|nr:D-glycero-beta-D-manno-heptose 1-phosphate adenylyltransferase [Jiangella ureilytica]TDC52139.1 D-glycero-beta-D-manno-heptose 1-phosphate adenylyltransferase [Jiangella ureilytica]
MTVRLTVIGDVLLDVDLVGQATRLAPDAPVPVLEDLTEHPRPGGAALAAWLAAGGADVTLVAPMAHDDAARTLCDLLAGRVTVLPLSSVGHTPVKERIRAGGQSVARLDRGGEPAEIGELTRPAVNALSEADAVLVSDYGRGVTAVPSIRWFLETLPRRAPVVWDPHPRGDRPVPGVHLVTPNAIEASTWVRRTGGTGDYSASSSWARAAHDADTLVREWGAGAVAVTLGARGALLSHGQGAPVAVPAPSAPDLDPCGAGDMFAAAAATLLGAGRMTGEAVRHAVVAATAYVAAGGATSLAISDGAEPASGPGGRYGRDVIAEVQARGGVVVATGGCFDLLHAGHVASLQAARRLGDALVVCLNSDASVRRLKGPARPVVAAADRARVLQALECVDAVEIFDDDTPVPVLRRLRPDLWAKGGDYAGAELPEAAVVREWGGQIVTLPYVDGHSTTALVRAVARSAAKIPELTTRRSS